MSTGKTADREFFCFRFRKSVGTTLNCCVFFRHSGKRKASFMIFQAAMPCSGRSKRRRDSQSAWASGCARIGNGAFCRLQAAEEGRSCGHTGRGAPMGAWTDAFAQNLRVTENDGCFPLFTPCRNAFLPAADSFAMEDPASCSEALPARSRAFRCREGVRLRSPLPARRQPVGARSRARMPACPGERGPRRTRGTHKFFPAIE